MGPIQGDRIAATYGFDNGVMATLGTYKAKDGIGKRYNLQICGSKGIIQMLFGSLPAVYWLDDPSWMTGNSKATWQPITSAGVGVPEPLKDTGMDLGNRLIVADLIESIEKDRQPIGSIYDGRASLEMILATYESHKLDRPVELPMKNRRHPLG